MNRTLRTRREFIRGSAAALASAVAASCFVGRHATVADEPRADATSDRPRYGAIGFGGEGMWIANAAKTFGELVAVCDVDRQRLDAAQAKLSDGKATACNDYRRLLDRKDIDAVIIATPDHWHAKMAVDALRAGKDVYLEKPMTLTIDEGKLLRKVVAETGRVCQVGTQQRSTELFLQAIAICHSGKLGRMRRAQCAIDAGMVGGPFRKLPPPPHLDWDLWLGPAPKVEYIAERCHGNFRWWYEYSGGKMTDWGAHHVDIAHWALGKTSAGCVKFEPVRVKFPVPYRDGRPTVDDCYNTAVEFFVRGTFADGVELVIRHDTDNGILLEGDKDHIFVNRRRLTGKPVEMLQSDPLREGWLENLYNGPKRSDALAHMGNFFQCLRTRKTPISDVASHHRSLTTCHLANIALRLDRPLNWDPAAEDIVGDEEARGWLRREPRKGFEING